jgi:catechol 2,3-dioxygenase-like lactoylglutathione lyase family enzyme
MTQDSILGGSELIAFAPTSNPAKARAFYEGVLGLHLVADEAPFSLVFDANGTMLRVTTVHEHHPEQFTILGWRVDDIIATVEKLTGAGIVFERYKGMNDKDPHAIWKAPSGARVAWFKDPDGNVLSLTEFPKN